MFLQQPQTLTAGTGEKSCCQFVYMYIALHLSVCSFTRIPAVLRNLICAKVSSSLRSLTVLLIMPLVLDEEVTIGGQSRQLMESQWKLNCFQLKVH